MKNVKLFEEFTSSKKKPIVLLLHGLDGTIDSEQLDILNRYDIEAVALGLDYRKYNVWSLLNKINPDIVIGHSLGGYLAYHLSNVKRIPALLLMPDFGKEMEQLQAVPTGEMFVKNKIALIGTNDNDVDKNLQKSTLKGVTLYYENVDHDVPAPLFEKYVKVLFDEVGIKKVAQEFKH
jgi:hypothetical protein